jgi:protein tyrosine phosphatase
MRASNISRVKSARRSVHGAPTQMAAGMKVVPTPAMATSPEDASPEDALGTEVVEDDCDEAVGAMASADAMKTAEWLKSAVDVFRSTIAKLQTDNGYSQAYGAMQMLGRDQPALNSQKEANKLKNRYGNIMAYDHSRVHLPQMGDDPDTTYINANWVDGYKQPKAYIASQGPVPNSFISFWRMIWHMKIETIVMVTHEVEKGKMKCHRYWPDPTSSPPVKRMQYGQITVSHLQSVPHKHFVVRTFDISFGDEVRTIKHFAYTSWPDHGVPLTTQELLGFRNAIHSSITRPDAPQVIHCSAGVGRTGTYIAIDRLMRSALDMGGPIDVDEVVQNMRRARNFMVQTEIQYMFIFRAVLDASLELLSGESTKAQAEKMAAEDRAMYEKQQEEAAKEEEARKAKEQAEIEEARKELLARTDNSAAAAASIIGSTIAERVKLLQNAEARWLIAYRASMEEWTERNKDMAEEYDTTSTLSPLQSRLEALQQKGLFDQANHS